MVGGESGKREGNEVKEGSGLGDARLEALEELLWGRLRFLGLLLLLEVSEVWDDDLLGGSGLSSTMLGEAYRQQKQSR